jgi:hypothetical protein
LSPKRTLGGVIGFVLVYLIYRFPDVRMLFGDNAKVLLGVLVQLLDLVGGTPCTGRQ